MSTQPPTPRVTAAGAGIGRPSRSRVTVPGHVYDVTTGLVQTVIPAGSSADRTVKPPRSPQANETP